MEGGIRSFGGAQCAQKGNVGNSFRDSKHAAWMDCAEREPACSVDGQETEGASTADELESVESLGRAPLGGNESSLHGQEIVK